ncbi:hypothetical protein EC973_000968 [Apophysomyces ossiformis]|uniref:THUMP domain-containing protein n=1 Tax=Apophysomyces ossiformis TaxID=679940 RepID=A0A8H7EPM5_9FUNG|nr:hypothetical protein EC973_000968 [Apophysomyces ossiformis]
MIQPDMSGIMITCARGREGQAVKEIMDVFNEYADELYPSEKNGNEEEEEESIDDLETSIAKEVEALKGPKTKKRFANIPTNTDCDIMTKQLKKTRYTSRLLPVEITCPSHLPDIERVAQRVIAPQFNTPNEDGSIIPRRFAVVARVRNCTKIDRMTVIQTLAGIVGPNHSVDLDNPELTIIVEICQTICMMSVVKDFGKLKKYNVESLLGMNSTDNAAKPLEGAKPADEQNETGKASAAIAK